jgi:hypothetical protein
VLPSAYLEEVARGEEDCLSVALFNALRVRMVLRVRLVTVGAGGLDPVPISHKA